MQIRLDRLDAHLDRDELRPLYVVSGDEPLQWTEALDAIRAAARARGFDERTVLDASEPGFKWERLGEAGANLSLFATRRLIEVRLPTGRPGTAGAKALGAFAAEPGADTLLLIGAGRIDAQAKKTAWYRALDKAGACIDIWPKERAALPGWLRERARARGLELDPDAAEELADRCEGNLAHGAQAIERLTLLVSGGRIGLDDVLDGATWGARFTSFDLVDATLAGGAGHARRALRVLDGLEAEGEAPPAVIGALAWELRTIVRIGRELESGAGLDQALMRFPAWRRRRDLVNAALRRRTAAEWGARLDALARLDAMSKGVREGDAWEQLRLLVVDLCGGGGGRSGGGNSRNARPGAGAPPARARRAR